MRVECRLMILLVFLILVVNRSYFAVAESAGVPLVEVTIRVVLPSTTPAGEDVYVSGSHAALGGWRADGLVLTKEVRAAESSGRVTYSGRVELPTGVRCEFKFTRGSWATVEKSASGAEIPNRVFVADEDKTVECVVASWADQIGTGKVGKLVAATLTGKIKIHTAFKSEFLNQARDVLVYLPPKYDEDLDERYSVLYMHDGQNVFDAVTSFQGVEWGADETAERLIAAGEIEPIIIVAIANTSDRVAEYTPTADGRYPQGGRSGDYGCFMVEELKPFIDEEYRTLPDRLHTGVAGSSLGGLVSLSLCKSYPEIFSRCAAISPSLWWDERDLLHAIETDAVEWLESARIWIDLGTAEGSAEDVLRLRDVLMRRGTDLGAVIRLEIFADGVHNEAAWAGRFDEVLIFLYGKASVIIVSPEPSGDDS